LDNTGEEREQMLRRKEEREREIVNLTNFVAQGACSDPHLNARVKLSLALTLGKEKGTTINFRAVSHPRARREDKKGCRLFVRVA